MIKINHIGERKFRLLKYKEAKVIKYGSPEFIALAQSLSYKYPRKNKFLLLFAQGEKSDKLKAAKYIAFEARRELLEINVKSIVNKYIGETEKNLNKIFEQAEESNSILFLDEADLLFSQRSNSSDNEMNEIFNQLIPKYKNIVFLPGAFNGNSSSRLNSLVDVIVQFRIY